MLKIDVAIVGICCTCQSAHPVYTNPHPEEDDPEAFGALMMGNDQAQLYLMAKHKAFGAWCEGEGTMPQAVVKD